MPAASRHLLAGRGSELAGLEVLLAQTAPDQLRVVVLAGEAGVGKSRLVAEFLAEHPEARRIVTHCLELGTEGLPFAPFAGLLRALVGELGREAITGIVGDGAAELARLAPGLGPPGPESRWGQGRLFEAFARLLMSLPAPRTTILVIEDIHWADPSTLDLLRFLTATLSGAPLLVVVTYRSDERPRHHPLTGWLAEYERSPRVSRVEVLPLDEDAVLSILAARAGLSDSDRTAIAALSQGIPFYVEELAAAYAAGHKYLPNALRSALTARASRLSPPAWNLATAASVAMSPVPHEVLLEVCGASEDEFDHAIAEALDAGVLTVDRQGRFAFRHDLTRQALADDLLPGRRSAVNARFAQAWQRMAKGRSAEIARHWARANDADRTAYWSLRAADEAAEVSAREEELRHLERLLGLPRQVWPREAGTAPDLLARAAGAAVDAGFSRRAEELLTLALSEVGDDDTERLIALTIARVRLPLVEIDFPELERLLPLTRPGSVQRARILAVIASGLMVGDVLEEGLAAARSALAEAEQAGDPLILSHVENTIGCLLLESGDEAGFEHFQRSYQLAEAAGSVSDLMRYYINLSAQLLVLGRYAQALEVTRQGRAYAKPRGLWTGPGAFLTWQEADALLMLGQWDEAVEVCEAGLHGRPAEGAQAHLLWAQAMVAARRGEVSRALELSAEMERRMEVVADRTAFVLPRAELAAELAAARGRFAEALQVLRAAAAHGHDLVADHSAHVALLWACILAASGSPPADDPELRAFLTGLGQRHPTWSSLPAVLLDGDSAQRLVLLDRVDAHGCPPYQAALLRLLCADQLLRLGQRELARPHVRRANELLEPLGAATLEGWRRRLAAASGADSRVDVAGREGLTPRELEVLELIARGLSNRQIAAELFISVKTASVHVSNILAKLGVASRTQAAAQWHAWQG